MVTAGRQETDASGRTRRSSPCHGCHGGGVERRGAVAEGERAVLTAAKRAALMIMAEAAGEGVEKALYGLKAPRAWSETAETCGARRGRGLASTAPKSA